MGRPKKRRRHLAVVRVRCFPSILRASPTRSTPLFLSRYVFFKAERKFHEFSSLRLVRFFAFFSVFTEAVASLPAARLIARSDPDVARRHFLSFFLVGEHGAPRVRPRFRSCEAAAR